MMNFFSVIFAAIVTVTGAFEVPTLKVEFHTDGEKSGDKVDITIRTTHSEKKGNIAYDLQIENHDIAYDSTGVGFSPYFECVRWDEDTDWELSICPRNGGTLPFKSFTLLTRDVSGRFWHRMNSGNLLPKSRTECVNFNKGNLDNKLIGTTSGPPPTRHNPTPYCWLAPTDEDQDIPMAFEVPALQVGFHSDGTKSGDEVDITITIRTARSQFEGSDAYDLQIEGQTNAYGRPGYSLKFECVRWDEDRDWELSICPPEGGTLPFESVTFLKKYDSEQSGHGMIPGEIRPESRTGCVNFEKRNKGTTLIQTTSGPPPESRNLTPYCWLTSEEEDQDIPDQDSATKNEIYQASQTQQEKIGIIGDYLRGKNK